MGMTYYGMQRFNQRDAEAKKNFKPIHEMNIQELKDAKELTLNHIANADSIPAYAREIRIANLKDRLEKIESKLAMCFWDGGEKMCRRCWECKEHYR